MSKTLAAAPLVALALLAACTPASHAENIQWTYDWNTRPILVHSDGESTGGVVLTNEPAHQHTNSFNTVIAYLWSFSSAQPAHPDRFTNEPYTLSVKITDGETHKSGTLSFAGKLSGTAWGFGFLPSGVLVKGETHLVNTFTSKLTQQIHLGHHLYTVTLGKFVNPDTSGGVIREGRIEAYIRTQHNPEPSTLVLCCVGAVVVGAGHWWRRGRASEI